MARTALGEYIHGLRRRKGYTLKQAAEEIGMNFTYLSKIENGHVIPEPDKLVAIARALDGSVTKMMRLSKNIPEEVLRSIIEELRQEDAVESAILARSQSGVVQHGLPDIQADHIIASKLPEPVVEVFAERFNIRLDDVAAITDLIRKIAQLEPATRDKVLSVITDLVNLNLALSEKGQDQDDVPF